jgi:Arylsulfotransferase (ASST)
VAFVTVCATVQANLTSVGGPPNGTVIDRIIQEIDISTDKVIWEWHALGHIPIADTYAHYVPGQPLDYFHLNSIQQLPNGHLIISARNTWAVYSIDKATGKVVWELGGKHTSFTMEPGTGFEWQHHATLHPARLMTVFDDAAAPPEEKHSRALEISLKMGSHRATLVHAFTHTPPTLTTAAGSVQLLRDRNVFVDWGNSPYFSEYTPDGRQLLNGSFRTPVRSYRAYLFSEWIGSPLKPPAIALKPSTTPGTDNLYASWNGATRVAKWQVFGSPTPRGPFSRIGSAVAWSSFETTIHVPRTGGPSFKVRALTASGHLLPGGTSAVAKAP